MFLNVVIQMWRQRELGEKLNGIANFHMYDNEKVQEFTKKTSIAKLCLFSI